MNDVLNRKLFKNKPYPKHGTGIVASFQEGGSTDDLSFQFDPFMWANKFQKQIFLVQLYLVQNQEQNLL